MECAKMQHIKTQSIEVLKEQIIALQKAIKEQKQQSEYSFKHPDNSAYNFVLRVYDLFTVDQFKTIFADYIESDAENKIVFKDENKAKTAVKEYILKKLNA